MKDKLTACGISAFIVATTVLLMPNMEATLRDNRVYLLGVAIIFLLAVMFARYSLHLSFFLFFLSIFMFFSGSPAMGSAIYYISMFCIMLYMFCLLYPFWKSKKEWVYNAVCGVILINVASQIGQLIGVNFPKGVAGMDLHGWPGLMGNVNETSCLLAVGLPFFFRRKWAWCIPVVMVGLILAKTTNGLLASALTVSAWLIVFYRKQFLTAFCAIIFVTGICISYMTWVDFMDVEKQMGGRGKVWRATLIASTVKPWGWGFGQYEYVIPLLTYAGNMPGHKIMPFLMGVEDKVSLDNAAMAVAGTRDITTARNYVMDKGNGTTAVFLQAHNDYLELLFDIGYAGTSLFLFLMGSIFVSSFRKRDKIPFYSLLASSATAVFFFSWQVVPVIVITILSLSLSFQKEEDNEMEECMDSGVDSINDCSGNGKSRRVNDIIDLRIRPFQRLRDLCKIVYDKYIR